MTTMKNKYAKKSLEEKKVEVQKLTKDMQTQINQYFDSADDLKDYLSFMSRFYQYSLNNVALIQSKFPGAQAVGSYQFWRNHGYMVNKGEKGIPILVPQKAGDRFRDASGEWKAVSKANEKEKKAIEAEKVDIRKGGLYFSIGYVFDIAQTNASAADLPKIFPNRWLEGGVREYNLLFQGMKKIAERNGIQFIEPHSELGVAKGVFYPLTREVALNPRNSELQNVKTLLHELTHAKLHTHEKMENYTDAEREFQAEMTAYAVSFYFGLDTSEYSLRYLTSWSQEKEFKDKTQLLKEVHETAVEFISTIEEEVQKQQEITHENRQEKEEKQVEERSILFVTFQMASVEYEFISIADLRQKVTDDATYLYRFSNRENVSKLSDEAFLAQFNTENKERLAAVDENDLDRPSVLIQWSENGNLKQNTIIPFGEANEQMAAIVKEQLNELGYQKTRYHLLIPKSLDPDFAKAEIIAMDRLDLGDGEYTSPYEQIIAEKPRLPEAVKAALKK
jgi:Zn-dependent peptidase ImmA (M78 family)